VTLEEFLAARLERYLSVVVPYAVALEPSAPRVLLESPGFSQASSWELDFLGRRLSLAAGLGAVRADGSSRGVRSGWLEAALVRYSWEGEDGLAPPAEAAALLRRRWPEAAARSLRDDLRDASVGGLDLLALAGAATVAAVIES